VVAADVVEPDAVVVEVVQDGQAELVALAVVGLGNAAAGRAEKIFLFGFEGDLIDVSKLL